MRYLVATVATLAMLAGAAPAFADSGPVNGAVTRDVIAAGPSSATDYWDTKAQNELQYLATVCPTVRAHSSEYSPALVRLCEESKG